MNESSGAGSADGPAGRAPDSTRMAGHAVKVPAHAAAPVRLDFAGGWTDVPPYSTREGGVVVAPIGALGRPDR